MRNALSIGACRVAVLTGVAFMSFVQPVWADYEPPFPGQPPASQVPDLSWNTRADADLCNNVGLNGWPTAGEPASCDLGIGWGTTIAYIPPGSQKEQIYSFVASCVKPTDVASCDAAMSNAVSNMNALAAWFKSNQYPGVVTWNYLPGSSWCQQCFGGGNTAGNGTGYPIEVILHVINGPISASATDEKGKVQVALIAGAVMIKYDVPYDETVATPHTAEPGSITCATDDYNGTQVFNELVAQYHIRRQNQIKEGCTCLAGW